MTIRTKVLINDMLDTMYEAMGGRSGGTTGWNPEAHRSY